LLLLLVRLLRQMSAVLLVLLLLPWLLRLLLRPLLGGRSLLLLPVWSGMLLCWDVCIVCAKGPCRKSGGLPLLLLVVRLHGLQPLTMAVMGHGLPWLLCAALLLLPTGFKLLLLGLVGLNATCWLLLLRLHLLKDGLDFIIVLLCTTETAACIPSCKYCMVVDRAGGLQAYSKVSWEVMSVYMSTYEEFIILICHRCPHNSM
jgi:hypothetical protein